MDSADEQPIAVSAWPDLIQRIRARTPARILVDRSGAAYRTHTQLELRHAHARARDAVGAELDLMADLGIDFVQRWKLFEVATLAASKDEYLLRPDLGRRLSHEARTRLTKLPAANDLQIVIGDGLSVTAVAAQVPQLLPLIVARAQELGWSLGQAFAVRHCRVGLLNEIGDLLQAKVLVLLIGERPGLATAESLSAYMAFRPSGGHTDANRNLVSNIHARGVPTPMAAERIINLAGQMMSLGTSGISLKELLPAFQFGQLR
jgi:ethanolamine ammonia-lyase small subunit